MPAENIVSVIDLLALPIPEFVEASYHHMLGRSPQPAEIKAQCGLLRAGHGRSRFLGDLAKSEEYRARRDGALHNQTDSAFLEQVYLQYLGRQIDPQGMAGYLRALARGKSRKRIVKQIAGSREARTRRTLWFELDQLLADERAQRHWLRRWIGNHGRAERSRNRMIEVARLQGPGVRLPAIEGTAATRSSQLDLHAADLAELGTDALRVLSRTQQAATERL